MLVSSSDSLISKSSDNCKILDPLNKFDNLCVLEVDSSGPISLSLELCGLMDFVGVGSNESRL